MFEYFKKILHKKKQVGFIVCFLTAIFAMPILSVNTVFASDFWNQDFVFHSDISDDRFSYMRTDIENKNLKNYMVFWNTNMGWAELIEVKSDTVITFEVAHVAYSTATYYYHITFSNMENNYTATFENRSGNVVKRSENYRNGTHIAGASSARKGNIASWVVNTSNSVVYLPSNYYNGNIFVNGVEFSPYDNVNLDFDIPIDNEYMQERKLYNFQIDLKTQQHLDYTHSFKIDYNRWNTPFTNLLDSFEFIGLNNNNGLYNWEKTDSCYINTNDYELTTSDQDFQIYINQINGDCLDHYEKVKLIVNLNDATIKFNNNININTNSIIHYNFLSKTSVVDILENYKYVNFTTNRFAFFDLMVRDSTGGDFYDKHFFRYFDKNDLTTTNEYTNILIEPYPLYNNLYITRGVLLDKTKGFTVFTHDKVDSEVFIFEYKYVYYSLTDNDKNDNIPIIDENGDIEIVDIDVDYPEPPPENIKDVDDGVNSLSDGINAVKTLYTTFYNSLTVEFQILHNLFFTLVMVLVIVKVVLK